MAERRFETDTPELRERWGKFVWAPAAAEMAKDIVARYPEGRQRSAGEDLIEGVGEHWIHGAPQRRLRGLARGLGTALGALEAGLVDTHQRLHPEVSRARCFQRHRQ